MKRSDLKRRTPLAPGPGPARTPMKRRPKKPRTWLRAYGSERRAAVMRWRACDGCGRPARAGALHHCHHVEGDGGTGLKASWRYTVTLCGGRAGCHERWHALGSSRRFLEVTGKDLVAIAARLAVEILP